MPLQLRDVVARLRARGGRLGADEVLERRADLVGRLVPLRAVLREALEDDARERRGVALAHHRRRIRLLHADGVDHRLGRGPVERALAGGELVEQRAHGEEIHAVIERLGRELLGREVEELALDDAGLRPAHPRRRLGDAEVDQLHVAAEADHHVLRADVAVDDAQRLARRVLRHVGVEQPLAQARDEPRGDARRHHLALLLLLLQQAAEIDTVHPLHRDEGRAVEVPQLEELDDARVVQRRRDARLVEEHADELGLLREVREDALEHHHAVAARVLGEEQLRHAADGEPLEQQVRAEGDGALGTGRRDGGLRQYV